MLRARWATSRPVQCQCSAVWGRPPPSPGPSYGVALGDRHSSNPRLLLLLLLLLLVLVLVLVHLLLLPLLLLLLLLLPLLFTVQFQLFATKPGAMRTTLRRKPRRATSHIRWKWHYSKRSRCSYNRPSSGTSTVGSKSGSLRCSELA